VAQGKSFAGQKKCRCHRPQSKMGRKKYPSAILPSPGVKIGFLYLLVNKYPLVTGNPLKERQIQAPLAAIQARPFQGRGCCQPADTSGASYHLEVTPPVLHRPTGNL
jgi:hypothetical protein